MTKRVRIDDEAESDLAGSAARYEREREGLGIRFVEAVEAALERIGSHPSIGGPAPGVPEAVGARHVVVAGFPFSLVYIDLGLELRVVAVAHAKREPGYWMK